jgi:TPR repeat protein
MKISYNTLTKTLFTLALILLAGYAIITWTGADKNLTAIVEGDYTIAQKQFREAAERGDAAAQYSLALMYDSGKGVPQDDAEALRWYQEAAEQGYGPAQYNLSMVYFFGKGTPQDSVAAYKWIILASAQGEEHAEDALPKLAEKMSPEQIAKAQAAAQAWKEKHRK